MNIEEKLEILYIEDNKGDYILLRELLKSSDSIDFEIMNADRLEKALEMLSILKYDVILLDLNLPDSNGGETFLSIHEKNSSIPVIIISGLSDETLAVEIVRKGADDYLLKGDLNTKSLLRSIRYSIERKKISQKLKTYQENLEYIVEQRTEQLKESERKFKSLADNIPGVLYRCANDKDWTMEFISKEIFNISGYQASEFINKERSYASIIHPEDVDLVDKAVQNGVSSNEPFEVRYRILNNKQEIVYVYEKGQGIFDDNNELMFLDGAIFDITQEELISQKLKQREKELSKANESLKNLLFNDSLTGAVNRDPFFEILDLKINEAKRGRHKLAVLFLDFEKFKEINDYYGHKIGDKALQAAVNLLKHNLRKTDIIGRVGGDEFIICLGKINSSRYAANTAEKINNIFNKTIQVAGFSLELTVSIGIALFPDDAQTANDLLRYSDIAMYKAKRTLRNSYQFVKEEHKNEISMEKALVDSINNNELSIAYQPIINSSGQCEYMEALLRWNNSVYGNVSPSAFIPILEKNKLIVKFGEMVIQNACETLKKINSIEGLDKLGISINLSTIQLENKDFIANIHTIIENSQVNASNLIWEITENIKISNFNKVKKTLTSLREKYRSIIAIDDYGSGYSSFSSLIELPIDMIKIDISLVQNINSPVYAKAIKGMILSLKTLNVKVVAKGVETEEQFTKLKEIGCDYYQGFYFAKPTPDIVNLITHDNAVFNIKNT